MSDTPAETKRRSNPYLPVLPEGWEYEVTIRGPKGARVEIEEKSGLADGEDTALVVTTLTSDGQRRSTRADDLATALRTAADGIKALHAVEQQEAEVKAAREAALAALGEQPQQAPVAVDE